MLELAGHLGTLLGCHFRRPRLAALETAFAAQCDGGLIFGRVEKLGMSEYTRPDRRCPEADGRWGRDAAGR
jgi:hypothetical protein